MTTLDQAIAQMAAAGMPEFPPGHPRVGTNRVMRYGPKRNAWYRLYEYSSPKTGRSYISGAYGWWGRIDSTKIDTDWQGIDSEERDRAIQRYREQEQRELERRRERARHAAARARQQWKGAEGIDGPWPYLERKGVMPPELVRCFADGTLLVPMFRSHGEQLLVVGLQKIAADGTKRFTKGMDKPGSFCPLWEGTADQPAVVIIAEGYATARSIRLATEGKVPVVVAFDAGNLAPVARAIRGIFPRTHVLLCADDDFRTDGNPGVAAATAAADEVRGDAGASVLAPVFTDRGDQALTDFNDLHQAEGLAAVREQLVAAIRRAVVREAPRPTKAGAARNEREADDDLVLEWRNQLLRTEGGRPKPTAGNVSMVLANDERWRGVLAKDEFSGDVVKRCAPPYEYGAAGPWTDMDDVRTRLWLERVYGFSPKKDDVVDAVIELADRSSFHPVRDYLRSIEWDGVDRLTYWAHELLGAPDNDYVRTAARKWMIQAVARVMKPGCKADSVLILEGRQGLMKSTALRVLAGDWFSDAPLKIGDKEAYVLIQGCWIVELAELDSFSRADSSAAKLFFSQSENHYRPWYARRPVKVKRQCVFAGSVNNDNYLKDDTGNRRYWPIRCSSIDLERLKGWRDQLWAQALTCFEAGEPHWVLDDERALFEDEQEQRYVADVYVDLIRGWLDDPANAMRAAATGFEGFGMAEIMGSALKLDTGRMTRPEMIRVGHCMRELGYVRRRSSAAGRPWVYRKGELQNDARTPAQRKEGPPDEELPI